MFFSVPSHWGHGEGLTRCDEEAQNAGIRGVSPHGIFYFEEFDCSRISSGCLDVVCGCLFFHKIIDLLYTEAGLD